jgi:hypothetical protein
MSDRHMRYVVLAALLLFTHAAAADLGEQLEAMGFSKYVRTQRGGITSTRAHLPFLGVGVEGGNLKIYEGVKQPNGLALEIKGNHFRFAAIDHGEFGGGLEAIGPDGLSSSLTRENTKGFFRIGAHIYAMTGIAHLSMNRGALYRIDENAGGARLTLVTKLTGQPVDVVVEDRTAFILTVNDLEAIDFYPDAEEFHLLVHDGPWDSVPTNMAVTSTQIAIGMHGGIVIVDRPRWRFGKSNYQYYAKPEYKYPKSAIPLDTRIR